MTRQSGSSGRTTGHVSATQAPDSGIEPLRKRKPFMFWFVVVAAGAMALSTVSSFLSLLF